MFKSQNRVCIGYVLAFSLLVQHSQLTFTYSKSTIEALEKGVKLAQS